jgi:uncharacterized protein (TIGR01777 family)
MRVIITGATGFIGRALAEALLQRGDSVLALTRNVEQARKTLGDEVESLEWHPPRPGPWTEAFSRADGVVNLAGARVAPFPRRWTDAYKSLILQSRLDATNAVVDAIAAADPRPPVLVNASGMDYYGSQGDTVLTEESPPGSGFLPDVARQWEAAARRAEDLGVRVVRLRSSIVLGDQGGSLPLMALPFRFFVGGTPGRSDQWVSWVHIEDEVGFIIFALTHTEVSGPYNVASPNPVRMGTFAREIGRALHRPSWLPAPPFLLKLVLGEQAQVVLSSIRVLPERAQEAGYEFKHTDSGEALRSALESRT